VDVTQLPFNRLIGLEHASGDRLLVALPAGPHYGNHVGTVHASVPLALAESGSGKFLLRTLGPGIGFLRVVRRLEAKFRRPAVDWVAARAAVQDGEAGRWATELSNRGRVSATVPVEVVDGDGAVVLSAKVDWFIARVSPNAEQGNAADSR